VLQGVREEVRERLWGDRLLGSFPIRQAVPGGLAWAQFGSWAHLVGVSGGENLYLGPCMVIKIYPALSATIRGRDGMDASRHIWM